MSLIDTVRLSLAPPHPASRPFLIAGGAAALAGLFAGAWLVLLGSAFCLFCLYFFRDPERTAPGRPEALLAPADGRVVSIGPAVPPEELGLGPAPRWRVGIFLSILNVHVNRVPADGTITRIVYRHGRFFDASLDKASEHNERNALAIRLGAEADPIRRRMSAVMKSFEPGLFVGGDAPDLPSDNLDLERWFRQPKGHERRIHGHRHAGVRIVQEGPTLLLALDAHLAHPGPFDGHDLRRYGKARPPGHQSESIHRRKVMRKARSKKKRGHLLAELERRYLASS